MGSFNDTILLSVLCKFLDLDAKVAGAWIGSSEFTNATGITAMAIEDEKLITAFTLIKVLRRNIFIDI
ncbi:hypothetical protein [Campylobacter lari]|uniref:hypothetical protein n=1 Tax=Campylobacter lari TaxID=201 RepID=UPI001275F486|nr:hypothetical protein [Campylobacter lari]EAJ5701912.1 hypothetical protein [Campylobacter lari]EAK5890363.1 hypothetical protein [Campylobacter lari]EGK8039116.1 hypothetical protein [Campylobacter lari]MCH3688831.1 hypothetical protein [Campylobacter lari]MCR2077959.1 hypothetical protein [Campylobacter lari subsp. concheus]